MVTDSNLGPPWTGCGDVELELLCDTVGGKRFPFSERTFSGKWVKC